ncbi:V-type proton ATPase subunit C isoform X2 [Anopheles darlingi]|uniref:V-type proton ATPase subunit C isoform X2 n=1 Tax=Anopheles darlingi TaxID=43151 RepID=UPI0021001C74|nr:V-type proton ATPase subunit C isoform X2 [Anopheles darlingi]
MSEYWLISAPGDKTCQQTWETMNQLTSKQNNLCENFKFHIPDLKVGTLDQLVGLSDDLGKLDAYVEQTTRKIAAYLGDVLEDQRDKLYENLQANNKGSPGAEQQLVNPTEPTKQSAVPNGDNKQGFSRHSSVTTSSSSGCSMEQRSTATVCSCPYPTTVPTTPLTPPTVVCQFFDQASPLTPSYDRVPRSPGLLSPDDDDDEGDGGGHSAPESDHGHGSGFEWRWFHRRKHSAKSRSRSSSHLFGGSSGGDHSHTFSIALTRPSPIVSGSSSCCGGGIIGRHGRGRRRHNRSANAEPGDEADEDEVYGGRPTIARDRSGSDGPPVDSPMSASSAEPAPPPKAIDPAELTTYITRFQWDLAKYPTKQSLRNIADIISKQVGQIDADLKTKSAAYNNLKGNLQNLEKKQSGSLLTRNLADLVKKEHFILDSEYLTTLLVIVPKANMNDWNAHYEKITDMIVPRSSQMITQDADYALCSVTLFKKVVDEFKLHARERKFVVREFVYNEEELAAGKNEITKLVTDKKKQFGPLVRWLKVNFSECFGAWVHVKALRVFVESVLRYGLPVNFQAILIHPNKKSTKRLRDVLQQLYGHLDGSAASSGGNADNVDIPGLGFGQSEYFPYVYYKLNVDMVESKV